MANEQAFVTAAMNSWNSNLKAIDAYFAGKGDAGLNDEIAPGKNRLIYLMGHLAAVHDRMIPLLGLGDRLHPELDALFLSAKDREVEIPATEDIRKKWTEINGKLSSAMMALSASDWLSRHASVSEEDFAKEPHRNRYSVLMSRTSHLWYHYGQMVLAPKAT
ncbi:MAG: DinB family protein [Gemmatimonadaceae bacterium]